MKSQTNEPSAMISQTGCHALIHRTHWIKPSYFMYKSLFCAELPGRTWCGLNPPLGSQKLARYGPLNFLCVHARANHPPWHSQPVTIQGTIQTQRHEWFWCQCGQLREGQQRPATRLSGQITCWNIDPLRPAFQLGARIHVMCQQWWPISSANVDIMICMYIYSIYIYRQQFLGSKKSQSQMAPNVQVGLPFRGCISNFWDTSFSSEQLSSASMCKRELFGWCLAWTQLICGASSIVLRRQTHLFPRQWWQIGELPSIAYNKLWRALGNINSEHCMIICDERVHWNSQITLILIISNACKNISVCTRCMHACMHANIYIYIRE